ncbi:hypothetical protein [Streptomyces sp. NPDC058622]
MIPGELETDPLGTASVLAYGALQAVQDAAPEYRRQAMEMLPDRGGRS